MDHKQLVEAALFMSQKPLDLHDLAKITGLSSLGFLKGTVEALRKDYEGRPFEIVEVGDGWMMQVRPDLLPAVASLTPYQDLPEGPKRSLALILYKEPVKQSEVIQIQGNKAYAYVRLLRKMGLVAAKKEGHTNILTVTKELEQYFGQPKERIREQLVIEPSSEQSRQEEPIQ